jgi:hypothetical protein
MCTSWLVACALVLVSNQGITSRHCHLLLLLLQVGGSCSQHSQHYSHSRNSLGCNYDAVIGSLPRGLSRDERQMAQQSAPPASPAVAALLQMPRVRTAQSNTSSPVLLY